MKYALIFLLAVAASILASAIVTKLICRKHPLKKAGRHISRMLLTLVILCAVFLIYAGDYYHADSSVQEYLQSSDTVTVNRATKGWYFDGSGTEEAVVFYPGAKVEETAYAPLMYMLAENGVDCFLVKMPLRMAFLDLDAAESVISSYDHPTWYIMGHSLGGSMAALYAADHFGEAGDHSGIAGIIFLASYSTTDLQIPALSIYGSEDGVLNRGSYENDKDHIKGGIAEDVIDGGNHSKFGNYGHQRGDGEAHISADEQQEETVKYILDWVGENKSYGSD